MKKSVFTFTLVAVVAFTLGLFPFLWSTNVQAATTTLKWEDTSATENTDYVVDGNTYNVYTAEGLAYIAKMTNSGFAEGVGGTTEGSWSTGKTIELQNDIDIGGKDWTPIGQNANANIRFSGTFRFNGYKVKNLSHSGLKCQYFGLFGDVNGNIIDPYVTASNITITAQNYNSFFGIIVGQLEAGGTVGRASGNSNINVFLEGEYNISQSNTKDVFVGLIVGQSLGVIGTKNDNGNVNIYAEISKTGSVIIKNTGKSAYLGGVVGRSNNADAVIGKKSTGTGDVVIKSVFNGGVEITSIGGYFGGITANLIGTIGNNGSGKTIIESINNAEIVVNSDADHIYAGGIVGNTAAGASYIGSNSADAGDVLISSINNGKFTLTGVTDKYIRFGGIIGQFSGASTCNVLGINNASNSANVSLDFSNNGQVLMTNGNKNSTFGGIAGVAQLGNGTVSPHIGTLGTGYASLNVKLNASDISLVNIATPKLGTHVASIANATIGASSNLKDYGFANFYTSSEIDNTTWKVCGDNDSSLSNVAEKNRTKISLTKEQFEEMNCAGFDYENDEYKAKFAPILKDGYYIIGFEDLEGVDIEDQLFVENGKLIGKFSISNGVTFRPKYVEIAVNSGSTKTWTGEALSPINPINNETFVFDQEMIDVGSYNISFVKVFVNGVLAGEKDGLSATFEILDPSQVPETITVTFKVDGKVYGEPQIIEFGGKASKPTIEPTKNGYVFNSWQLEGSDFDFNSELESNIELVANFDECVGGNIYSANLTLQNNIIVNFKIELDEGYSQPQVKFGFIGNEEIVSDYVAEDGKFIFKFNGVTPQYLTEGIDVVVTALFNGDRVIVATKFDFSVRDYCVAMFNVTAESLSLTESQFDSLKALLIDLLNYGAEAQIKENTNTSDLANTNLDDYQALATEFNVPEDLSSKDGDQAGAAILGAKLVLDNKVFVVFKVDIKELQLNDIKVVIKHNSKVYTYSGDDLILEDGTNYIIQFSDMYASNFDKEITIQVYDGDNIVSPLVTYSVNSYIARHSEDSLMQKLYCYGYSAKAYLESITVID